MPHQFDHERLIVYRKALEFVQWAGTILEAIPVKMAVKDQLDRASTSIVLNIAEGNGKRSRLDRCRYFDSARASGVECAACVDVLVIRGKLDPKTAAEGKLQLLEIVSMAAGLIARFSSDSQVTNEEPGLYAEFALGNKEKEKE